MIHTHTDTTNWLTITRETLPDGPATLACMPGVSGMNAMHAALFAAARTPPTGHVAVLGPSAVPTALWAVRSGADVHHITDSIAETNSLTATLSRNRLAAPQSTADWLMDAADAESCDLALLHLPRGRARQHHLLHLAAALLRPGGQLILVGAKNEGVKGAVAAAAQIYGRAGVVVRKGGYHVAMATRPAAAITLPEVIFTSYPVNVDSVPTQLISCAGAFAPDRIDDGAAALITGMQIQPGTRVLDLGCGTGMVTLAAARRGADSVGVDVSARAVASAKRTLVANGYPNIAVHLCCGAAAISDSSIDTVVTNPPFHTGHNVNFDVSQLFVREAHRVLKPHGHITLVANRHLDYGPWLREHFAGVGTAYENTRFRVWHATKY